MEASIGSRVREVEAALDELSRQDAVGRIWRRDHTLWNRDPAEISDRLGWLTVANAMEDQVTHLESFAEEVRDLGFRHVVLLGMGGSSLGSEVLRTAFGSAPGYPELVVLDSTVPGCVRSVQESVDPVSTLFLVSSKSGTTVEVLCLFRFFYLWVASAVGEQRAGGNFVAITDPGTPLAKLAADHGFRSLFLNPPDIGGRYSVLSYFGLVPAALAGINTRAMLERANSICRKCERVTPLGENPAALLGAIIGSLALCGLDKLTLFASPALGSFGLWVEQLIAESTGKRGKGIIPVVGEPLAEPRRYGEDRLFVYLRLENDEAAATDQAAERLKLLGQPLVTYELRDKYDLGAEFFRWEFATAIAAAVLRLNPFDQPDVRAAKDATQRILQYYVDHGEPPCPRTEHSIENLLGGTCNGE